MKNKKNEVLTTEDGKPLVELRLEAGDEFIPLYNSVLEKTNDVEYTDDKGKLVKKKITNFSLKVRARDSNKQAIVHNGESEVFVRLTPAQAESLKKKISEGVELNQHVFVAYTYESKDYGEQIGVGLKKANKPALSFEEFDAEQETTETTTTD